MPELTRYATTSTSNMCVNKITEKEYIKFWQEVRKWNYEQDRKRLSTLSMGATLALLSSPTANPKYDSLTGAAESSFLAPVLKGNLSKYHSNAMNTKEMHMLESLRIMIEASETYSGVERELVLGAVWLLDIATQISRVSWCYVSEEEKKDLRSNYRALKSIRDWDRNSSSWKILHLTFILHGRRLIAYLANNTKESEIVASLQTGLDRIIRTEFPSKLMREIVREENAAYKLNFLIGGTICLKSVDEVSIFFVKDESSSAKVKMNVGSMAQLNVDNIASLFMENSKIYICLGETYGNTYRGGWKSMLIQIMQVVTSEKFIITDNPMPFHLKKI